jgi:hypothetical protein
MFNEMGDTVLRFGLGGSPGFHSQGKIDGSTLQYGAQHELESIVESSLDNASIAWNRVKCLIFLEVGSLDPTSNPHGHDNANNGGRYKLGRWYRMINRHESVLSSASAEKQQNQVRIRKSHVPEQ